MTAHRWITHRLVFVVLFVVCVSHPPTASLGAEVERDPSHALLDERFKCGRNAVYVLASILGRPVSESQLSTWLVDDPGPGGLSLLQLQEAAAAINLPCVTRLLTFEELKSTQLPVVAHFAFSHANSSHAGHYVVLVKIDDEHATWVDCTTSSFGVWKTQQFRRDWSGYVLQPAAAVFSPRSSLLDASLAVGTICLCFASAAIVAGPWLMSSNKRSRRRAAGLSQLAIVGVVAVFGTSYRVDGSDLPEKHPSQEVLTWRTSANDALNCTYLLLRLYDIRVNYLELIDRMPPTSGGTTIQTIRDQCRSYGLPTIVTKWTPDRLRDGTFPVLAHLSERVNQGGGYVLVVACRNNTCYLVTGSSAIIEPVPMDVFRRHWSGYALTVGDDRRRVFAALGISIIVASAYWMYRMVMPKSRSASDA